MTYAELQALLEKTADEAGRITAEGVVAAAADPNNPLHADPAWLWDDNMAAAHQYRLAHAGRLIRRVPVFVRRIERRQARVPVFVRDPKAGEAEPGYVALTSVETASPDAVIIVRDELRRVVGILKRAASVAGALAVAGTAKRLDGLLAEARELEAWLGIAVEEEAAENAAP